MPGRFLKLGIVLLLGASIQGGIPMHIDKLWDYSDPLASRERFEAEVNNLDRAQDPARYLELMTQIARTHSLKAEFEQAHEILDTVKAQWEQATPLVRVRYYLERGRTFNSAKDKAAALPLFEQAFELGQAHGLDFYTIDAAHMMVIASPPEDQVTWSLRALKLAEASADPRAQKWEGSLSNNLAWTYHDLKDYPKALAMFQQNLAWHQQNGSKKTELIAQWSIARVQRSLQQYDVALAAQQEVLAQYKKHELPTGGYVYEEIAENLLALDRAQEAQSYFQQAYAHLSQDPFLQKYEAPRLERLKALAQIN